MSLVERLAAAFRHEHDTPESEPSISFSRMDARWWLNALADELEAAKLAGFLADPLTVAFVAHWLRTEADIQSKEL